jgi:hypothetical protein
MATNFKEFVDKSVPPHFPRLPLVHVTDAYGLKAILNAGEVAVKKCDHFGQVTLKDELLAYFSLGTASYRPKSKGSTKPSLSSPAALIFDFDEVGDGHRIFPFDTGAFINKIFLSYIDRRLELLEFQVGSSADDASRCVQTFFESNEDYLKLQINRNLKYDPANFHVDGFLSLVGSTYDPTFDDRKGTIEVQYNSGVPLTKLSVLGVVMPDSLETSELHQKILNLGVTPSTYRAGHQAPSEWFGAMKQVSIKVIEEIMRGKI